MKYGSTVSTKDKDHAWDEEFSGRRSICLEQFAIRPENRNSPHWRSLDIWRPTRLADW